MEEYPTKPRDADRSYTIYVASDATGLTAERVVQAALTQFESRVVEVVRFSEVRTEDDVVQIVRRAARERGIIVHTLVVPHLREVMVEEGRHHQVDTIDLMGPLLTRLSTRLHVSPQSQPGLFRQLDEEYYRRIEAVDYTVKHDDGQNPQDLPHADIVVVGVSRTCKTPLSIYLSYRGWRVMNVPVVPETPMPRQMEEVQPGRIVAVTMDPEQLVKVRMARMRRLAQQYLTSCYASAEQVAGEVRAARQMYRRRGWPVVDVTNKSVEEVSTEVIALVRRRHLRPESA